MKVDHQNIVQQSWGLYWSIPEWPDSFIFLKTVFILFLAMFWLLKHMYIDKKIIVWQAIKKPKVVCLEPLKNLNQNIHHEYLSIKMYILEKFKSLSASLCILMRLRPVHSLHETKPFIASIRLRLFHSLKELFVGLGQWQLVQQELHCLNFTERVEELTQNPHLLQLIRGG